MLQNILQFWFAFLVRFSPPSTEAPHRLLRQKKSPREEYSTPAEKLYALEIIQKESYEERTKESYKQEPVRIGI
ncbi:hypothetical protein OIU78_024801 [Salix suchowensis]|nr:hypothetical protein OIU78_024801 [Salix suchowensis]